MKILHTNTVGNNFTIHFETDDCAEAERVFQFIHDPNNAGMSDDLKVEIDLLNEDRELLKQTVDKLRAECVELKKELDATKDCLSKTNSELDRVARERDDAKGKFEAAQELLRRETRKPGSIAVESFNIVMSILRAEGYNVDRLLSHAAFIYHLTHRK